MIGNKLVDKVGLGCKEVHYKCAQLQKYLQFLHHLILRI